MTTDALVLVGILGSACGRSAQPTATPAPAERMQPRSAQPARIPLAVGNEIKVQTADGVLIQGTSWPGVERRRGSENPNGVIVFVHEYGSDRSEWTPFVRRLVDRYTVVAIDMRGHGKSTARVDGTTVDWRSLGLTDWVLLSSDVSAVVEYLGVVEPENSGISLVGSALGGTAIALHAAEDRNIHSVALLSPRLSDHGLEIRRAVERMQERPVLLLSSEGDPMSARATRQLAEVATRPTVKIYPRGGHGTALQGPVVEDLTEFLRKTPATRVPLPGPGSTLSNLSR